MLGALERYAEALASYDRALALQPDFVEALCDRARILHGLNRHEEALESYDRVLALRPNDTEAPHQRGLALLEKINRGINLPRLHRSADISARYARFFINLDRSPARRAQIEAEIERYGLLRLYRRFSAADGNLLGCSNEPLTAGEIGCITLHFLLLKQNVDSALHIHVIEDGVLLSRFVAQTIESVMTSAVIDRFDILFTGGYMMRREYSRYKALYDQRLERDAAHAVSSVQPHIISYVAGTTSYIANRHSISKLVEIFERELKNGLTEPLDLVIRRAVDLVIRRAAAEGKIRIGCLFPFVTTLRLDGIDTGTIADRGKDPPTTLAFQFGRHSFSVDRDHAMLNAQMAYAFASHTAYSHPEPEAAPTIIVKYSTEFSPFRARMIPSARRPLIRDGASGTRYRTIELNPAKPSGNDGGHLPAPRKSAAR